jgi:hypothetical protein
MVVAVGILCAATISTTILVYVVPDEVTTARGEAGAFLAALLMYGLFYGAFFIQSFLSGNYIAPSDSLDFGVADYLSSPAVWTQGMWSGYPIAADPQALTWYPVLRLLLALGADWNTFLIAAYVLTSASTLSVRASPDPPRRSPACSAGLSVASAASWWDTSRTSTRSTLRVGAAGALRLAVDPRRRASTRRGGDRHGHRPDVAGGAS